MKVKIFRICKDNPLPKQAHPTDAGWDVFAAETISFFPDEIKLVPLGIIAQAPEGFHFKLCIRSSIPYKRGFIQPNAPGIIDSSYCGPDDEISIMLKAPGEQEFSDRGLVDNMGYMLPIAITKGERIGQLILEQNYQIEWDEQLEDDFAKDSRGGFGSSGK